MNKIIKAVVRPVFFVLLFMPLSCSSSVWNNPHGLLGGLFGGSPSSTGNSNSVPETSATGFSAPSRSTPPDREGVGFSSISPPRFIHIVPFEEGDGFYLQWTRVTGATDYLLYSQGSLVADVPRNVYKIHGLLPCRTYRFAIWSSNGAILSKTPLKVHARTLGCLRTR